MSVKVDLKEVNQLAMQMRQMHRSALPNVVRNTLNDMALQAKKKELTKVADEVFTNRTENFFKSQSGVKKATGFNLRSMVAEMGMSTDSLASRNLKQQDEGGNIPKRAFIPLDKEGGNAARTGKSFGKKIAKKHRLSKIDLVDSRNTRGSKRGVLPRTVAKAAKLNKHVLHNGTVFAAKNVRREIKKGKKGRNIKFRLAPLYSYDRGRSVQVKAKNFMEKTSIATQEYRNLFFKNNFKEQVERLRRKGKL